MPRKPSVKTKETEPLTGDPLVELKSQFDRWLAEQNQRDQYLQDQLEQQSEMFLRIESRLNTISEQVLQLALGSLEELDAPSNGGKSSAATPATDTSVFSSWQSQREQMLEALSSESELADRRAQKESTTPRAMPQAKADRAQDRSSEAKPAAVETNLLEKASAEDLNEIEALKAQLQEALRETEIELSIQRAKLSQERQRLEEFESALNQRERSISRQNLNGSRKQDEGIVKRLKGFLSLGGDKQS